MSRGFKKPWGWVNERISILGCTVPLSAFVLSWLIMMKKIYWKWFSVLLYFPKLTVSFEYRGEFMNDLLCPGQLLKETKRYWKLKLWSSFIVTESKKINQCIRFSPFVFYWRNVFKLEQQKRVKLWLIIILTNMLVFFSRNARSGISDWHVVDRQRRRGDNIMKRGSGHLNASWSEREQSWIQFINITSVSVAALQKILINLCWELLCILLYRASSPLSLWPVLAVFCFVCFYLY